MASEPYNIHISTTADPSGAHVTQDELERTAAEGEKIVDAVTKGDRATAAFVSKLKQLSPEQIAKVEAEMRRLAEAEEAAGRDAAGLRAQLQRIADVNLEKQVKNASGLFSSITAGTLAASAITEVTRALTNHLQQSVALADQLDDLAGRAGVTASELQRIGNTASENNGSIQGTADALSKVQQSAQGAIEKDGPLREMFHRLGIEVKDLKTLSPEELFYKIADSVHASSDRGRTFTDVVGVMGRSSKDLFTTLELGSEQIRKTGDAIGVFSDDTIKKLASAKDSLQAFQNQLTIFAGNTIQLFSDLKQYGTETLTDSFSELFGLTTQEIAKFNAVQDRAREAASGAKKEFHGESDELDSLAVKADEASKAIKAINDSFSARAIKEFPVAAQIDQLKFKIERLRDEAAKELPGTMFRSAAELNAAANNLTDAAAQLRVKQLAQRYAQLEDQVRSLAETQKKAAEDAKKEVASQVKIEGDLIQQLRSLTAEASKPNLSVAERIKLLEQELVVLEKIKASEQTRTKAANAANPAAAGRVKELDEILRAQPTGRTADADRKAEAQRERAAIVRETGVGADDASSKLDDTIKKTQSAIDKLKESIGTEGAKIAPGLEGVDKALGEALKSFDEGLTKTKGSVETGTPKVVESVQALETSVGKGLEGIAAANRTAAASVERRFAAVQQQLESLWRAV
jgi:chromosome segregation ATPase